jgi:hypothetical protein
LIMRSEVVWKVEAEEEGRWSEGASGRDEGKLKFEGGGIESEKGDVNNPSILLCWSHSVSVCVCVRWLKQVFPFLFLFLCVDERKKAHACLWWKYLMIHKKSKAFSIYLSRGWIQIKTANW